MQIVVQKWNGQAAWKARFQLLFKASPVNVLSVPAFHGTIMSVKIAGGKKKSKQMREVQHSRNSLKGTNIKQKPESYY